MPDSTSEWFTAIQRGQVPVVDDLLAARPELAAVRDAGGISSVMWACYARQEGILARLLALRPALDLFEAVAAGEDEVALAWLERDAKLAREWSPDGFTALHFAAFFVRPKLAERLLELGADAGVPARNATHVAPLHSAAAAAANDVARLLLARGVDANARQTQGFTALMSAAQQGNDALAELLLSSGADPEARADDGRSAADLADQKGNHALAARLRGGGTAG